jgi:hypothetical protein
MNIGTLTVEQPSEKTRSFVPDGLRHTRRAESSRISVRFDARQNTMILDGTLLSSLRLPRVVDGRLFDLIYMSIMKRMSTDAHLFVIDRTKNETNETSHS